MAGEAASGRYARSGVVGAGPRENDIHGRPHRGDGGGGRGAC